MKKLTLNDKIETERLIIEMPKVEDAKKLYDLIDDDVLEYMPWEKWEDYNVTINHIKEVIERCKNWESWDTLIRYKKNNKIIWRFWIIKFDDEINSVELWYWLARDFWWNWFINECVEKIKEFCFNNLSVDRILIRAVKENIKSRKVAERSLFKLDWILRRNQNNKWKIVDMAYYTFLKEDYS